MEACWIPALEFSTKPALFSVLSPSTMKKIGPENKSNINSDFDIVDFTDNKKGDELEKLKKNNELEIFFSNLWNHL